MRSDGHEQVAGAPVVEEEDALPRPQSGAVRNSSGPACPWMMSSASPGPIWWTSRSEWRWTGFLRRARDGRVSCVEGRRMAVRAARALEEGAAGRDGGGAARYDERGRGRRQEPHEESEFLDVAQDVAGSALSRLPRLFGVRANWQFGVSSRSCGKSSLVIPISTLYASPENSRSDLFWAFQPNRAMVPSLPFLFVAPVTRIRCGRPKMPSADLPFALPLSRRIGQVSLNGAVS